MTTTTPPLPGTTTRHNNNYSRLRLFLTATIAWFLITLLANVNILLRPFHQQQSNESFIQFAAIMPSSVATNRTTTTTTTVKEIKPINSTSHANDTRYDKLVLNDSTIELESVLERQSGKKINLSNWTSQHTNPESYENAPKHSHDQTLPFPYWNLSCPLEMSSFSASHMGGADFLQRAKKARQVAMTSLQVLDDLQNLWPTMAAKKHRRILFLGDSVMRQVFISLSCHLWASFSAANEVEIAVPWFTQRNARTVNPNTFATGPHSKFEEARVWWKHTDLSVNDSKSSQTAATELIFHHGIGGLLSLNGEYQSHDDNMWIKNCFFKQPFDATVVSRKSKNIDNLTERNVQRETIRLHRDDVVIMNGSVHGDRNANIQTIADLMRCMRFMFPPPKKQTLWPHFVYLVTSSQHFPTKSGIFHKSMLNMKTYQCTKETDQHEHQDEELRGLRDSNSGKGTSPNNSLLLLPMIGQDTLDIQYKSGNLHIGNRDCTHWIMPGIPDLLAASVVRHLLLLS